MEVKFELILQVPSVPLIGVQFGEQRQLLLDIFNQHCTSNHRTLDIPLSQILGRDPMVRFVQEARVDAASREMRLSMVGVCELGVDYGERRVHQK